MGNSEDSYLYLFATEGKMFANDITNGSFLAHQHANKNILQKRTHCRRFLGELTKQTTSKEVEERPELEIMAKTPYLGNKNYFHFRTYMIKHYTYGYFSGIQSYNGHLTSFAARSSNTKLR